MLDRNHVVRLWNPAAVAITGLEADAVVGRRVHEVIAGWERIEELIPVVPAYARGSGPTDTVPIEIAARELWLSISGIDFPEGTAYTFRDLTRERLLLERQTEFLASAAHAFRTPLTAIYGAAATLRRQDVELAEEMRELLISIIYGESDRLSHLVDDVLLLSRIESGTMEVVIEQFDPADVARLAIEAVEARVSEPVSLELTAPPYLPPVAGDAEKVRHVLVNLLDNAVKYSPAGGRVEVALQPRDWSMLFSIRDEGPGIPAGEQRDVFEKFYRVEGDATRGRTGAGLGLYVCRELVRRMEGRIWVDSRQGNGSTLFVELPLARAYGGLRAA